MGSRTSGSHASAGHLTGIFLFGAQKMAFKNFLRTSPGNPGTASSSYPQGGHSASPSEARRGCMQRLASGTNHTCFHCVPTKGSCESPTPDPRDAATDPAQFGDFPRLPTEQAPGKGDCTREEGVDAGRALLSSHIHGVTPAPFGQEASGKDLDSGPSEPPTACVALVSGCTCLPASTSPAVTWSSA